MVFIKINIHQGDLKMSFLDDHFQETKQINTTVIVDLSNTLHSTFHAQVRFDKTLQDDNQKYDFWRFLILNQLKYINQKFKPDEIVLAIDSTSWRKKEYKYYKANRVLAREKQKDFNAEEFYSITDQFIQELTDNFPYKVIKVSGAEADDIIGTLANKLSQQIIIVSRDKDFKQLLKKPNVKLFDPILKEFKEEKDPYNFLIDHILRGDSSDGIPNMLSDDNVFVNSDKRQKRITKKVVESVNELGIEEYAIVNGLVENYERNKLLVELSDETIPKDIWNETVYEYNQQKPKGSYLKVLQFLRKHKIKSLVDSVDSFLLS